MPRTHLPYAARLLPQELHGVALQRDLLFTRRELLDAGVSEEQMRWRVGREWSSPLPGVVRIGDDTLDDRARRRAALLYAGSRALLAGPTAANLHGLHAVNSSIVHLLVPRECAARRQRWVIVHRSSVGDPRPLTLDRAAVTSLDRAVLDTARWATGDREAEAVVIEACQRRLTSPDRLFRELARFGRAPGTARARRAVAAADTGVWSVAESDLFRLLVRSSTLPEPLLNPRLSTTSGRRLTTPDLWFDDVALAVMVHSKAHHRDGEDWERTVSGDSDLNLAGAMVLGIVPTTITRDPRGTLVRVERAYAAAAARPRPATLIAVPRAT